jgi:hypothetical protein
MNDFLNKLKKFLAGSPSYAMAGGFAFDFDEETPKKETNLMFKKGGGEAIVEKPVYSAPPTAPAPVEAATQEEAVTPEEEAARKKEALKQGAKSLQIPTTDAATTSQVGTGK